jgi:hypothetical protein
LLQLDWSPLGAAATLGRAIMSRHTAMVVIRIER